MDDFKLFWSYYFGIKKNPSDFFQKNQKLFPEDFEKLNEADQNVLIMKQLCENLRIMGMSLSNKESSDKEQVAEKTTGENDANDRAVSAVTDLYCKWAEEERGAPRPQA
jgi:hypothetical protein